MATTLKINSSSPSDQIYAKSLRFFLLLSLLFVLPALVNSSGELSKLGGMAASTFLSRKTLLSVSETPGAEKDAARTVEFNSGSSNSKREDRHQFGANKHEVPTGPNPISNR
ncbi:hypothetical protein OROGR_019546 [Orobanche gracilis]